MAAWILKPANYILASKFISSRLKGKLGSWLLLRRWKLVSLSAVVITPGGLCIPEMSLSALDGSWDLSLRDIVIGNYFRLIFGRSVRISAIDIGVLCLEYRGKESSGRSGQAPAWLAPTRFFQIGHQALRRLFNGLPGRCRIGTLQVRHPFFQHKGRQPDVYDVLVSEDVIRFFAAGKEPGNAIMIRLNRQKKNIYCDVDRELMQTLLKLLCIDPMLTLLSGRCHFNCSLLEEGIALSIHTGEWKAASSLLADELLIMRGDISMTAVRRGKGIAVSGKGNAGLLAFDFFYEESLLRNETIACQVNFPAMTFEQLHGTLPPFYFEPLRTLSWEGLLSVHIEYACTFSGKARPVLSVKVHPADIVDRLMGDVDLRFLQFPFTYSREAAGKEQWKGIVGAEDHRFRQLAVIPGVLINTILCTEDPHFYGHKGIDTRFMGKALFDAIKIRKFKKGASTITMQLARNLFLHQRKSLLRKLEEMLLAVLIEQKAKISKARILEIYLNIIEFGPGVYGIAEACEFYFHKDVQDLTIMDCLVLSYIIPRPRHFMDALYAGSDMLKRNLSAHIQKYLGVMKRKGFVADSDLPSAPDEIIFAGRGITLNFEG